jgi:hypothetical protein
MANMIALEPQEVPMSQQHGYVYYDLTHIDFDSTLTIDEETGIPAFALPPKQSSPMRRSFQTVDDARQGRRKGAIIHRTNSQKRKREQGVSFREDNLLRVQTIERVPEECKADVWYQPKDLTETLLEELKKNYHLCWIRGFDHPLEEHNLTWRGIEEYIPSPDNEGYDGHSKRLEKIRNQMEVIVSIARRISQLPAGEQWDLGEHCADLSKSDREEAIEKARKDALEVLTEEEEQSKHVTLTPQPSEFLTANSCESTSVIGSIIAWFCLGA